jgi:hypothetical protein
LNTKATKSATSAKNADIKNVKSEKDMFHFLCLPAAGVEAVDSGEAGLAVAVQEEAELLAVGDTTSRISQVIF